MSRRYILLLIFMVTLLADCATHKKEAYVYPGNLPEKEKEKLFVIYEKGRKLYEPNCSKCHGIFTKGKDGIPNFSIRQVDSYTARFLKGDAKNHAVAANMDAEQLHEVFMFLRFRKVQGSPAVLLPDKQAAINK